MAAQQLSTAIKEEWSLTEEQVALIEGSTAHAHKPGHLMRLAAGADADYMTILVPIPALLELATGIVAAWPVKEPSKKDLNGSSFEHHLNATTVVAMVYKLVDDLKEMKGFVATARKVGKRAIDFIIECLRKGNDDDYVVWDATSISKEVLSIGQDSATPYNKHETDLSTQTDYYCQIQVALAYRANLRSFTCGYSFVYRSSDELTEAINDSGTLQRINAIRILYANLLANDLDTKGSNQVKLVGSNKPYPDL